DGAALPAGAARGVAVTAEALLVAPAHPVDRVALAVLAELRAAVVATTVVVPVPAVTAATVGAAVVHAGAALWEERAGGPVPPAGRRLGLGGRWGGEEQGGERDEERELHSDTGQVGPLPLQRAFQPFTPPSQAQPTAKSPTMMDTCRIRSAHALLASPVPAPAGRSPPRP